MVKFLKDNKIFIVVILAGFIFGVFIHFVIGSPCKETPQTVGLGETGISPQGNDLVVTSGGDKATDATISQGEDGTTPRDEKPSCSPYADAGNFIGETKCLSGKVSNVYISAKGTIFIDFCADYKTCPFSAVIFSSDSSKFSDVKSYQGKTLEITGLVSTYQGRPEIVINDIGQIKIK